MHTKPVQPLDNLHAENERLSRLLSENADAKKHLKDMLYNWLNDGLIGVTDYNNAIELINRIHD